MYVLDEKCRGVYTIRKSGHHLKGVDFTATTAAAPVIVVLMPMHGELAIRCQRAHATQTLPSSRSHCSQVQSQLECLEYIHGYSIRSGNVSRKMSSIKLKWAAQAD